MSDSYINRASWDDVGSYLNAISQRVNPHDFSGVYGIPRGGSVLSAWLSHKLYLPLLSKPQPNCIVVDDICDSGRTLNELLNSPEIVDRNNCFVTVMFYRVMSYAPVDYYYREKDDKWIVFPWEQ